MTLVPVSSVFCAPQMLDSPAVSDDAKGQLGGPSASSPSVSPNPLQI